MSKDIPADVMERAQAVYAAIGVNWGDDAIGRAAEMRRINVPKIALALLTERREAEQRGAERMREAAASECILVGGDWRDADIEQKAYAANYLADRIRALPTTAEPAVQEPRVSDDEAAPLVMSDSLFATLGKMIHILENCQGGTFDKGTKPIDLNRVMDDLRLASALLRNMHTKLGNARATIASQAAELAAKEARIELLHNRMVEEATAANNLLNGSLKLIDRAEAAEAALKAAREALKAMLDEHAPADDAIRAGMEPPCNDMARAALTKGA